MPDIQTAREESRTILAIAKRACALAADNGFNYDLMTVDMDLSLCHMSNPLKLDELMAADNGNFAHDVFGIRRHLNRETGKLEDCFSPRYSR